MRALILINKRSRRGENGFESGLDILRSNGMACKIFEIERVKRIPGIIHKEHRQADLIVLGGGDGTFNVAVEALLASGLPLGIMPLGTANDLARSLGIPGSPPEAARIILDGRTKRIDLGWVNGKHFFNVASIGVAAGIRKRLTRKLKKRWGVLAYPLTLISVYQTFRPFQARIIAHGKTHTVRSIQVAVGNGRSYGGGLIVHKDAAIDDHCLNLYSLAPQPPMDLIRALPGLLKGTYMDRNGIWFMDGREFRLSTTRPMTVSADGELIARTPVHFKVIPAVLPVYVPESGS